MFAEYVLLPILMFSPIFDVSSPLPQPFNSRLLNFLALLNLKWVQVPSCWMIMLKKRLPFHRVSSIMIRGLFLTHQEIDPAQQKRLGIVIFPLRPT